MALPRYTGKELTKFLRQLAVDVESSADDGTPQTKAECLARLLWQKALGYKAQEMRGEGASRAMTEVYHPPESWAIQMIYERLEGKVANSAPEDGTRTTAAERISDLSRQRINAMAGGVPAEPKKLPPKLRPLP